MSGGINTTRNGATIGVEGERKMADEHGNYGFRTEMRNNPDGSVTMLRTRDGWNEFTTTGNNSLATYPRGFGMAPAATPSSTLFVPDDWRTLTKTYKPLQPTYFVMPLATNFAFNPKENHKWNDVLSWQGAEVRVNGRSYNTARAPIETPAQCVPVYVTNSTSSEGSEYYASGHLFMVGKIAVYSVSQTDVTRYVMAPETPMQEGRAYLGGPKIVGGVANLWQLFFAGDPATGFWSFLHATMAMGSDGSVAISDHAAYPCWGPGTAPTSVAYSHTDTKEGYQMPDTLIGWRAQLEVLRHNYDGGEEHFLESIDMVYKSTASAVTIGTNSYCRWISDVAEYSGVSPPQSFTIAGESFSRSGSCQKTRTVGAGYVWRDAETYQGEDQFNEAHLESLMTATHGWWTHGAPGVPQNSPVGVATISLGGEIDATLRQNRETANCTADSALSHGSEKLIEVTAVRYDEWGSYTHVTPIGYVNGALGEPVALATVRAEIPILAAYPGGLTDEEFKEWLAAWKAHRAVVAGATSGELGGGVAMYAGMNVIHHNGQGEMLPYSKTYETSGKSTSSISFSTNDYFLYDTENGVYGCISGSFSANEETGNGCTATLTVTLSITTPQSSYSKQLCSLTLPMSDILPLISESTGLVADYLPTPAYSCMFAPKIQTQGCFHGIAYTTAYERQAGAIPHFLANFKLSLCGHNGGNEDSEDSGTGNSLVVMPGHLIEMLHCYVYSSSYGMDPDYSYPVHRVATYNTIQKGLFEKSWVVHLHNNDQGNWTGNVDLANFNLTTTGVFRT